MNEQRLQAHRDRLTAMEDRLTATVSGLADEALRATGGEASGSLSNTPMHLGDLAATSYEQEVASGLLQTEQEILGAIRAALGRIDAGTFGRCEHCGRELPEGRLEAVPYATSCVACEAKREQREADDFAGSSRAGASQAATLATRPRRAEQSATGAETIPPGATPAAQARATTPPHGPNDDAEPGRTIDDPARGEKAR